MAEQEGTVGGPSPRRPPNPGRPGVIGQRLLSDRPVSLYRITRAAVPVARDFYSAKQLGDPPIGNEIRHPELHESISMWTTANAAKRFAVGNRKLGKYVTRVMVTPHRQRTEVQIHPTPHTPGHCDVWGVPEVLLALAGSPAEKVA